MIEYLDIKNIAFQILGYPISYVELIATLFGLISVYFATKENILTWGTGIINEIFLFILFFQVQLYADMFLQIYFFLVTLYGWYNWKSKSTKNKIEKISFRNRILLALIILLSTFVLGFIFSNIHLYLKSYFKIQATYPFSDSFIMASSIVATILLAKKKIENWYIWIVNDIICILLYFKKGIYFLSIEYMLFLGLVFYGLYKWEKEINND